MQNLKTVTLNSDRWQTDKVEDCFLEIVNGTTIQQNDSDGIPITRIETIQKSKFDLKRIKYVKNPPQKIIDRYKYNNGDLVLSHINSLEHVGKVAIYEGEPKLLLHGMNLLRLRPNQDLILPKYAYYYMLGNTFRSEVKKRVGKAVNQVSLNQSNLKEIPFLVPPISLQKGIVGSLDNLLPSVGANINKLTRTKQLIKKFRQAILSAAITGKLTEDWQLKNLGTPRVQIDYVSSNKKRKVQFDISHFQLFDLPEGWEWRQFWEVAEIKSNLVSTKDYQDYVLVAPDNIERNTGKLLEKKLVKEINPISAKHLFFKGQIVYSKIRPYLSKLIFADFDGLCSADMYPISPRINVRYLMLFMLSKYFLDTVSNIGTRTLLPKTNQEELNSIPVPVPSLEEQEEIVAKVDAYLEIADKAERQIEKAEVGVAKLTQAILAKTFSQE